VLIDKAEESDVYFVHLNVWESRKGPNGEEELYRPTSVQEFKDASRHIDAFKENDLVLLSFKELDSRGKSVKQIMNEEKLLDIEKDKSCGMFLAVVNKKRTQDTSFIQLKIDREVYAQYLHKFTAKGKHSMWCYFFDSLSTTIREFKTIKRSEFFPAVDLILNPASTMQCLASLAGPSNSKEMTTFLEKHETMFNKSQFIAL
jgi:hypothetical protein